MKKLALLFSLSLMIASCKHANENETIVPPANLYSQGLLQIEQHHFRKAADTFDKLYFQHPNHDITPYAELMQAYALFLDTKYEECVDVLTHFLRYHPLHQDAAYAQYMIGMSYYMQIYDVQRDQGMTFNAKQTFNELISNYPTNKYALDAKLKLDLIDDHLAGKELEIGREYIRAQNPIAAINRYQTVVDKYSTTTHIQEALYRLVEAYVILGIDDQAIKYANILGHNYPSNNWYQMAYKLVQLQPKLVTQDVDPKVQHVKKTKKSIKDFFKKDEQKAEQ